MRPLDARQRPSERASGAKALRCVGGAYVAFMARAAGIHPARITRPGVMACGRGNGSRPGQRSTSWCERPERSSACFAVARFEVYAAISCHLHTSRPRKITRHSQRRSLISSSSTPSAYSCKRDWTNGKRDCPYWAYLFKEKCP